MEQVQLKGIVDYIKELNKKKITYIIKRYLNGYYIVTILLGKEKVKFL